MKLIEEVVTFCKRQKSIALVADDFMDRFTFNYKAATQQEQDILAQCAAQMFRKFYYSALDNEVPLTLANIVNILCEREFGREWVAAPVLALIRTKKTLRMEYRFAGFSKNHHPMVQDLEFYLREVASDVRMEDPGLLCSSEYPRFEKELLIYDRHYLNMLGLIALENGYLECTASQPGFIGKTTPQAEAFFGFEPEQKLRQVIETVVQISAKTIREALPEFAPQLTEQRFREFLQKPASFFAFIKPLLKKVERGVQPSHPLMSDAANSDMAEDPRMRITALFWILDVYFFTPCGYYLQLLQPIYPLEYDLQEEFKALLGQTENIHRVRQKLFSMVVGYHLTSLGNDLFNSGKRTAGQFKLPKEVGDDMLFLMLRVGIRKGEPNRAGMNDQALHSSSMGRELFQGILEGMMQTPPAPLKRKSPKLIDFPKRKAVESPKVDSSANQVFVFKVKLFYSKRVWRQIEIKGSQSLDHLHEAIFDAFELEPGHLYSFYLSNRFWDEQSEYTHPHGEGRSAAKKKIGTLGLGLKQKIAYIYDFGDEHRFEVELVAMGEAQPNLQYPREVKRNKPVKTVCDQCKSTQQPIEWFCAEHEVFLCGKCADQHEDCYLVQPFL